MKIGRIIILICFFPSLFYAQSKNDTFYKVIDVTKVQVPDSIIIGEIGGSAFADNGHFYMAGNDLHQIYHFNAAGKLLGYFGREGRGPGEFFRVLSIELKNNRLYLLDYENARIQVFGLDGTFITTIKLENPFFPNLTSKLLVSEDEIQILGFIPDNNNFIHTFDFDGSYLNSFGSFIDFPSFLVNPTGRRQITQLTGDMSRHGVLYTVAAPYKMFFYSKEDKLLWQKTDPVIPKPWKEYMTITPTKYHVEWYPATFNTVMVDDNYFLVYWFRPYPKERREKGKVGELFFDLRSLQNGELLSRSTFNSNMLINATAVTENNHLLILTRNRESRKFFLYRLAINPKF